MAKAIYHTFGCKLNFAETATVATRWEGLGVTRAEKGETPDIIFINSCSVTEEADKKCRQAIRRFNRLYPSASIIITGCYASLKPGEAASLPGVVTVVPNSAKATLDQALRPLLTPPLGLNARGTQPSPTETGSSATKESEGNQPGSGEGHSNDNQPGSGEGHGNGNHSSGNHGNEKNQAGSGEGSAGEGSVPGAIAPGETRVLSSAPDETRPLSSAPGATRALSFAPSCARGDRTRYFLKVQDGCDCWCTYCTIPAARGLSRSATIAQLVGQAQQAASEGGKEIVLTGVNIGDFGKRQPDLQAGAPRENFLGLIQALDSVEGIERYRISSLEPDLLSDEMIEFCARSRSFMPHFHIPLQCGSDAVLKLMHRHYDTSLFRDKILKIKKAMPDAFIGVDLIVGARGETPEEFQRSYDFVESLPITRLHIFPYSERPGTKALNIEHTVSQEEKHRRMKIMTELSDRKLREYAEQFVGQIRPVLLEHSAKGQPMSGFTDNYLKVRIPDAEAKLDNRILPVKLLSVISTPSNELEFLGELHNE